MLRPARQTIELVQAGAAEGRWGVLAAVALGIWFSFVLVGSFFGLAVTRMAAIERGVSFKVANRLGTGDGERLSVNLRFRKMDDFGPAAVARQVPALARLLEAREQLANLLRYMDGKVAASDQIKALLADPQLMLALKERLAAEPAGSEAAKSEAQE